MFDIFNIDGEVCDTITLDILCDTDDFIPTVAIKSDSTTPCTGCYEVDSDWVADNGATSVTMSYTDNGGGSVVTSLDDLVGDSYMMCYESLTCLLYTSPSPRDATLSRMPSSA